MTHCAQQSAITCCEPQVLLCWRPAAGANRHAQEAPKALSSQEWQTRSLDSIPVVQGSAQKTRADGASGSPHCQAHQATNNGRGSRERQSAFAQLVVEMAALVCKSQQLSDENHSTVAGCPAKSTNIKWSQQVSAVPLGFDPTCNNCIRNFGAIYSLNSRQVLGQVDALCAAGREALLCTSVTKGSLTFRNSYCMAFGNF
mmetsp:Transcript_8254/g.18453  ORF Transcript_8254/g.18453 Transcript_8254/m.18453 type:complete len:200 (-) Transcript_8254:240-839(-)